MKHDHPTFHGYEVGEVTTRRCEFCGGAMAFQYERDGGYYLSCVVDPALDHRQSLAPQDLSG